MWSIWKFYGRHYDLVYRYGIFVSQMTTDMCDRCDAGTTSYSGTHEFITSTCISTIFCHCICCCSFLLSFFCLKTLRFNYHSLSNMYDSIPDLPLMFDYHGRQTIWLRCHKKCSNYWYLNGYWFSSRRNNWKKHQSRQNKSTGTSNQKQNKAKE